MWIQQLQGFRLLLWQQLGICLFFVTIVVTTFVEVTPRPTPAFVPPSIVVQTPASISTPLFASAALLLIGPRAVSSFFNSIFNYLVYIMFNIVICGLLCKRVTYVSPWHWFGHLDLITPNPMCIGRKYYLSHFKHLDIYRSGFWQMYSVVEKFWITRAKFLETKKS